ncbi:MULTISPECIES: SusD/RagB family nutrient-binding outer membrane lipoprotein [Olivibacter]|uniref:SusD/RagB family nutrient-binding outer membrane lipoprotein n=1 Tax=Olivibacter jilunii TaxID=985016 RepID=A0ABW6AZN2_9SPHI|nr:SusD/RagB family nutrient-binding outer membrane lipoprotein [Olivibacter sp. UJ_SKK_5.1]MDX3911964.1 SusD/RagB family nutrient-binding outer membrane lipoprotein [Pseudosphingobacterium sp.]
MKKIIKYSFGVGILALVATSCTKNFEEINTNPNSPTEAPLTNLLAFSTRDHAASFFDAWGDMNEPSTYAAHLGKIQYIDEARYIFRPNSVENIWTYASRDLKNLQIVIEDASEQGATNMQAAALTVQSMIWQATTDRWRDVPFTDALKADEGSITPKYSTQEEIYPELLNRLKIAAELFNQNGSDELGNGDLIYGGDIDSWKRFANSLRLRVATRISNVNPELARAHIEEILTNPSVYPVIETNDQNALLMWPGELPYLEPWADDQFNPSSARDDHAVSDVLVNQLKSLSDPRLSVYAKPATADNEYRGAAIGPNALTPAALNMYSRIGARFRDNRSGFTPFLRASEVKFLIAEAAFKGWSAGVSAQQAYNDGVRLSLEENGVSATNIAAYLAGGGAWKNNLNDIYLQKWIALFKNGNEAWAETRRTDVPLLPPASGTPYSGHNRPPFRYPYPNSEINLNGPNSSEFVSSVVDNFWGKKMWWDTREGVN